mgnify:CR=1 FL=1
MLLEELVMLKEKELKKYSKKKERQNLIAARQLTKQCMKSMATETKPVYFSPANTYTDWYFPDEDRYKSLEWAFVPIADPAPSLADKRLLHYYAYNFALENAINSIGGGYAGFQTNGILDRAQRGKVVNFSIWGSNEGKTSGWLVPNNPESKGVQIMFPYLWEIGHQYRFELTEGPSGIDTEGKWWGLWVTDKNTGKRDFIGEQQVPLMIEGKSAQLWAPHTSMFGEDMHWWRSLNGHTKYDHCSAFECSAMAAMDITANGGTIRPLRFTSHTNSGELMTGRNSFQSVNCDVSIYQDATHFNVQHNLGYWATPAPNLLNRIS